MLRVVHLYSLAHSTPVCRKKHFCKSPNGSLHSLLLCKAPLLRDAPLALCRRTAVLRLASGALCKKKTVILAITAIYDRFMFITR